MEKPWRNILALACWGASCAALLDILSAGHPVQAHLVHSDALYLPVLFADVLEHGGRLRDWFLTPAPYFFPDMPLYWLAWLGSDGIARQTTSFALLQSILTALALYAVAHQVLSRNRLLAAATLATLFIWLGLHAGDPFVRMFGSAHHYGAFVAALLLMAAWLRQEGQDTPGLAAPMAVAIAALVFLSTLSDALFLAQTVIPLLAALLICRQDAPRPRLRLRGFLLLFVPAFAAMLSYKLVVAHPTRYSTRASLSALPGNLAEIGRIGDGLFGQRPLLALALLLSLGLGLICMASLARRRPLLSLPRPLQMLAAFALLSFGATVSAMLLSKNVMPVPRYLIGALAWPLVAGGCVLAHMLGERWRYPSLLPCAVLASLLATQACRVNTVHDTDHYFYPEQIACIDRALAAAGARHGIAQYWDAKRLQALSLRSLSLAQYTDTLEPMKWITSERFFRTSYDFAIIAEHEAPSFRLPRDRITAINGEPRQVLGCGDRTILLYPAGQLRTSATGAEP